MVHAVVSVVVKERQRDKKVLQAGCMIQIHTKVVDKRTIEQLKKT